MELNDWSAYSLVQVPCDTDFRKNGGMVASVTANLCTGYLFIIFHGGTLPEEVLHVHGARGKQCEGTAPLSPIYYYVRLLLAIKCILSVGGY